MKKKKGSIELNNLEDSCDWGEKMSHDTDDSEKPTRDGRRGLCSKNCMTGSVVCVALSSITMFIVFWCTNIFRDTILSSLEIRNGTSMFDWWQRPPVRPVYRVRIFNYTNVVDFQNGNAKKLNVVEAGPYMYRETMTRVNPTMNEDGTITYQEKRSFQWEGGSPDDEIITVPNVPLLSAMAFTRDMSFVAQVGLTAILSTMQVQTFVSLPAGGFLWGYDDKIFEMAKPVISWQENIPFDKFGVLAFKNGLSADRITINTGKDDINNVGLVQKLNGRESRKVWGDEKCDKIEGTDGTIFPNKLFEYHNETLKVYARDMCRSLTLKYHGRGMVRDVPTLTYKPPLDSFTSTATKDNCYCTRRSTRSENSPRDCPPAGIFNSSACTFNMPLLASFPHFYGGDPNLLDAIDGLNPRAKEHETVVEIHPRLGVPIGGYSRVQMNLEARKAVGVPFLGNIEDGLILPLIWIEVAIDTVPDSLQNLFYHAYFTAAGVQAGMQWISLVGIVFSICIVIRMINHSHRERHGTLKRNVSGQNPLIGQSYGDSANSRSNDGNIKLTDD